MPGRNPPSFCASCTRDFAPGDQRHVLDGAVICSGCNADEMPDARTPEHRQLGYAGAGSIGGMRKSISDAHRRIVKRRPSPREGLAPGRDAVEAGHDAVRLPLRDRDGKPIDKYEAQRLFGDDTLIHVASTTRYHVFQRPAPKAETPTPINPLESLEPYRRKA